MKLLFQNVNCQTHTSNKHSQHLCKALPHTSFLKHQPISTQGIKKLSKVGIANPVNPINCFINFSSTANSPKLFFTKLSFIFLSIPKVSVLLKVLGKYFINSVSLFISINATASDSIHLLKTSMSVDSM